MPIFVVENRSVYKNKVGACSARLIFLLVARRRRRTTFGKKGASSKNKNGACGARHLLKKHTLLNNQARRRREHLFNIFAFAAPQAPNKILATGATKLVKQVARRRRRLSLLKLGAFIKTMLAPAARGLFSF